MVKMYSVSQYITARDTKESTFCLFLGRAVRSKKDSINEENPKRWPKGWKFTLFVASCTGILVLSFNIGFLLWVLPRHNLSNGRGLLYDGDCGRVHKLSTGLHFVVNIFGTLLLSSSNYTMQCLSAPTRADIEKTHKNLNWLDIGISSVRNFRQISRGRSVLWIILVLSSLPLHLMYNSTIFATTSANSYYVFLGDEPFGRIGLEDLTLTPNSLLYSKDSYKRQKTTVDSSFIRLHNMAQDGTLEKLDNTDCINAYMETYQNPYVNVLLVTDNAQNKSQYIIVGHQEVYNPVRSNPYPWMYLEEQGENEYSKGGSYLPKIKAQVVASNWTILSYPVRYCLAEVAQRHCKLQYNLSLTVVVIIFIVIKVATICYVAFTIDTPILTTGDAISSFIKNPDMEMRGECLLAMNDVGELSSTYKPCWMHQNRWQFTRKPKKWYTAVPPGRWCFGLMSFCISITVCATLLGRGLSTMPDKSGIWTAGLQALDFRTLISVNFWPTSLIPNTLIANLPQLIYSVIYFAYNSILTTMTMSAEWSQYATQRKGLRVSTAPRMAQRSKYFLSLPYRYAIPLMAASSILHWLISQSLFLVGVEAYNQNFQREPSSDINVCGYSPVAIVCSISVGTAMVACLVGLGCKRFKSGMPVAGSCSLAIAAACCPNPKISDTEKSARSQPDMECLPLQWGVLPSDEGSIGHCTFSSDRVSMPVDGGIYH